MPRVWILLLAWCCCALAGMGILVTYELTPSPPSVGKANWPEDSQIRRATDRPTLLVFLHPKCPCSRASLVELHKLAIHCEGRFTLHVVFVTCLGMQDWCQSSLHGEAQRIRAASLYLDQGGTEAARFNAATSGEALLYSEGGRLLFQGGLTVSRGHEGDNAHLEQLSALLQGETGEPQWAPVYGCPLLD